MKYGQMNVNILSEKKVIYWASGFIWYKSREQKENCVMCWLVVVGASE